MVEIIAAFAGILLALWLFYWIFATVWQMAEARGRNPWFWFLVSLCWSPFGSMFVLWAFYEVRSDGG